MLWIKLYPVLFDESSWCVVSLNANFFFLLVVLVAKWGNIVPGGGDMSCTCSIEDMVNTLDYCNIIEDEYEFVYLVTVRVRSCP